MGRRCVHDFDFKRANRVEMDVALRKRDANSGAIEKCINAVAEFTPHAAAVHPWTEAHPKLKTEHERVVAEVVQQHIRSSF